jgi:hypothetical protein
LRRQAGRDPMARRRGLGLRRGILTRRIAAVARRRCALRVHRPSPTLTSAIPLPPYPILLSIAAPHKRRQLFSPLDRASKAEDPPPTLKANMAKGRNRE